MIPTEPIGSIPRPQNLIDAMSRWSRGQITEEALDTIAREATADTIRRFEAAGSPVITDGEQSKPSFATYSVHGAANLAGDGIVIHLRTVTRGNYHERLLRAETLSNAIKAKLREVEIALDPLKLLEEVRAMQSHLVVLANGGSLDGPSMRETDLPAFSDRHAFQRFARFASIAKCSGLAIWHTL